MRHALFPLKPCFVRRSIIFERLDQHNEYNRACNQELLRPFPSLDCADILKLLLR